MDYKKEYDDICQKLMSAYNTTSFIEVRKVIEGIHPELRESEDERIRKSIRELLLDTPCTELVNHKIDLEKAMAWLEMQKEQKPAEWSEEDEKKLEDLTSLLAILEGCSTVKVGTSAKYCFWLNALRSRLKSSDNWKPSDEQMIALYNMIPFVKSVGGPSEAVKPLESLYEDLKKL